MTITRYGQIIRLRPGSISEYEALHAAVWPEVLEQIKQAGLRNYSIFRDGRQLFSYFEYTGNDFEADMATLDAHPVVHRWHEVCMNLQEPLDDRTPGEWWKRMAEVFHEAGYPPGS